MGRQDLEDEPTLLTRENIAPAISLCCSGDLPGDLMLDILSRLPVKSLLRFRRVCKTWKNLIASPTFINKHLILHSNKSQPLSLLLHTYEPAQKKNCVCKFSSDTAGFNHDQLCLPFRPDTINVFVIGSSNGLVCIGQRGFYVSHKRPFALWNPATREFRFLPLPRSFPSRYLKKFFFVKFSFLSAIRDYKLVCISSNGVGHSRTDKDERVNIDTFTVIKNSWKTASIVINPPVSFKTSSKLLNGYMHWLGIRKDGFGNEEDIVISYDMCKETFQQTQMPSPSPIFRKGRLYRSLAVLNESMVMFVHRYKNSLIGEPIEIWITNYPCDALSWIKHLTIAPLSIDIGIPVGFWLNGEEIIFCDSASVYKTTNASTWNNTYPRDGKVRNTPSFRGKHTRVFRPYVDSLVSVKGTSLFQLKEESVDKCTLSV